MPVDRTKVEKTLEKTVERAVAPFERFAEGQASTTLALVGCTVVALVWANSPAHESYGAIMATELGLVAGDWSLSLDVRAWVSDGLMAFFFYLLGLELKREFIAGQFADLRQSLPVTMAALGGMLVPVSVYLLVTQGNNETTQGWGIPMATDAAFAIGLLTLLRNQIPVSLFAFLTALAIIDDLGAIIVIAFFYSDGLNPTYLAYAAACVVVLTICNLSRIHNPWVYALIGVALWYCIHHSGLHATIAGVLVAACVPARSRQDPKTFINKVGELSNKLKDSDPQGHQMLAEEAPHELVEELASNAKDVTVPLRRWEDRFEHPVLLFIMPVFALANAGISVNQDLIVDAVTSDLGLGIAAGLLLGKLVGVSGAMWLAVKLGWGSYPPDCNIKHIVGVSLFASIGFTMSIFISGLSFDVNSAMGGVHHAIALSSVMLTSLLAALLGVCWFKFIAHR